MRDLLSMLADVSAITVADILAVIIVQRMRTDRKRRWHKAGPRTRDLFGPRSEDTGVISWALILVMTAILGLGLALTILTHI